MQPTLLPSIEGVSSQSSNQARGESPEPGAAFWAAAPPWKMIPKSHFHRRSGSEAGGVAMQTTLLPSFEGVSSQPWKMIPKSHSHRRSWSQHSKCWRRGRYPRMTTGKLAPRMEPQAQLSDQYFQRSPREGLRIWRRYESKIAVQAPRDGSAAAAKLAMQASWGRAG